MIPDLEAIGFTRNQANVYLALLRAGRSTVQQLANATGLNRVTVHTIIEKFESMQLCCSLREGKARTILPLDPVSLQLRITHEADVVVGKQQAYTKAAPQLRHLYQHSHAHNEVLNLRGLSGYRYLAEDILSAKQETWMFVNVDLMAPERMAILQKEFFPRKHALGIPAKYILPDTPSARQFVRQCYLEHPAPSPMEAKFIGGPQAGFFTQAILYADTVVLLDSQQGTLVLIKNPNMCHSSRELFSYLWQRLGPALTTNRPTGHQGPDT